MNKKKKRRKNDVPIGTIQQDKNLTIKRNKKLSQVIITLETNSGYSFFYSVCKPDPEHLKFIEFASEKTACSTTIHIPQ